MAQRKVARRIADSTASKRSSPKKAKDGKKPDRAAYADFLPKPLRAPPQDRFDRLDFVRPWGSLGGHSAWDPPQPGEELLKKVFRKGELTKERADCAIGYEVGTRAARDYARVLKTTAYADTVSFLVDVALDMLGTPTDKRRRGEAIGFFSELEEILHRATNRARRRAR